MKKKISITLDEKIIKIIDKQRKDLPRSIYVNKILKNYLKGGLK